MKTIKNKPSNKIGLPSKFKTKPYLMAVGVVAFALVLGGTAYASNGAKPGDVLYSLDTTSEKVQSVLTFGPAGRADLALSLATERVEETQAVLEVSEFDSADLNMALTGLAIQKKALADLVVAEAELKQQVKQYEDAFEEREATLDATFKEAKNRLKAEKKQLKAELELAETANNAGEVSRITAALTVLDARLEALEAEKEAAEEALEAEEERLEAEMEAREQALEAEEEAREAEIERLEEEADAARERADEASEAEKEQLEQEAERAEQAAERAREAEHEQEEPEAAENDNDNEASEQVENQSRR